MREAGLLKRFHDRYWPKKVTKPPRAAGVDFDDVKPMFVGLSVCYMVVIFILLVELVYKKYSKEASENKDSDTDISQLKG